MTDQALFTPTVVHCFFQRWCNHTITALDPQAAHDDMESHYQTTHYGQHMSTLRKELHPWLK